MSSSPPSAVGQANPSALPFYLAAAILSLAASAAFGWLLAGQAHALGGTAQAAIASAGVLLLLAAAWIFVWPARLRLLTAPLLDLPTAFMDARSQITDIQAIRKEHYKLRTDIEGFAELVQSALQQTGGTLREAADLIRDRQAALDQTILDRKRVHEEQTALRLSVGDAKREAEEWQKAAILLAGAIERTSDPASGISESYLKAASEFVRHFERTFKPLGLDLIRPVVGEPFNPASHEIAGERETADARAGDVANCDSWGYVTRAQGVVVKARVQLAKAPAGREEGDPIEPPPPFDEPGGNAPDPQELVTSEAEAPIIRIVRRGGPGR